MPDKPRLALPDVPEAPKIITRNDHWVVVCKPFGMLTVPGRGPVAQRSSLLEWLQDRGIREPRTIGRLDRAAGGLVLFALNADTQRDLTQRWNEARTIKRYRAVTFTTPSPPNGIRTDPIAKGRKGGMRIAAHGKPSETHYKTLATDETTGRALVEVELRTGRRHQIRLHLAATGAPIVDDTQYLRAAEKLSNFKGPTPKPAAPNRIELVCAELRCAGVTATLL